jgi:hypothetical protein
MKRRLPTVITVRAGPDAGSPNIHLFWLCGWFGCLRADRPVMAGQRLACLRIVPCEHFPEEDRAVPRGGRAAARLHRQPIPRALTTPPAGTASGASLFRKLDAVAVPTARLLPAPGSVSAISRGSPAGASAPGCSARWCCVRAEARTEDASIKQQPGHPAARRTLGPRGAGHQHKRAHKGTPQRSPASSPATL